MSERKQKNTKLKYPLRPNSKSWEIEAGNVARQFCPGIIVCKDCGAPVVKGYCCDYCESTSP